MEDAAAAGAFDAFYAATAPEVTRQVFLVSGDVEEAEDAVHTAYARAWQDWARVGRLAAPESWARREATAIVLRPWRGLGKALGLRRERAGALVGAYGLDTANVLQALDRLPAHRRVAVVLHEVAGLDLGEVAAEMEATFGTARARVARGREAFAAALAEHEHPARARAAGQPKDAPEQAGDPVRARLRAAAEQPRLRLRPAEDVRRLGMRRQGLQLAGVAGLIALVMSLVGFAWWHEEEPSARRGTPAAAPTGLPGGVAGDDVTQPGATPSTLFRLGETAVRAEDVPRGRRDYGYLVGWSQHDGGTFLLLDRVRVRGQRVENNDGSATVEVPLAAEVTVEGRRQLAGTDQRTRLPVEQLIRFIDSGRARYVVFRLHYDGSDQVDRITEVVVGD